MKQKWCVTASLENGEEAFLYMGNSYVDAVENHPSAWKDYFCEEIRRDTVSLNLKKWHGNPEKGNWHFQKALPLPFFQF